MILGFAAVVIALAAVAAKVWLPREIERRARSAVARVCPECTLQIGAVSVRALGGVLVARDVVLTGPIGGASTVRVRADRLEIDPALTTLRSERPRLERVLATGVTAVVGRRDVTPAEAAVASPEPRPDATPSRGAPGDEPLAWWATAPPVQIDRLEVNGGRLRWTLTNAAVIQLDELRIRASNLATRPSSAPMRIETHGRLQQTAPFELAVHAPKPYTQGPRFELRLQGFDVSSLNDYLRSAHGIVAHGVVERAVAAAELEGGALRGSIWAHYRGLDLEFKRTQTRSAMETLMWNLRDEFGVRRSRAIGDGPPAAAPVLVERRPGEGSAAMMLRGLREALVQLVVDPKVLRS